MPAFPSDYAPQGSMLPLSIVARPLYHANLRGAGGTFPGDLRRRVFSGSAYAAAVARLYVAAAASSGLVLTGEEAQALILGHALAIVACNHVGRLPIVPDTVKAARAAEAAGATVKPDEGGALVVNPYSFVSLPAGTSKPSAVKKALSLGCASLRVLTSRDSLDKAHAGPKYLMPDLPGGSVPMPEEGVTFDPNAIPGFTPTAVAPAVVIGLAVVVVSGLVVAYGTHRYFSAEEAHRLAVTNAALAVSLERIKQGLPGDTPVDKLVEGLSGESKVSRLWPTVAVIAGASGLGIVAGITIGKDKGETHSGAVRRYLRQRRAA